MEKLMNVNEVNNEAISHAEKKEFSKFADKVKTSLEDKLRDNPIIKDKSAELKSFQDMKDTFAKIEGSSNTDNTTDAESSVDSVDSEI